MRKSIFDKINKINPKIIIIFLTIVLLIVFILFRQITKTRQEIDQKEEEEKIKAEIIERGLKKKDPIDNNTNKDYSKYLGKSNEEIIAEAYKEDSVYMKSLKEFAEKEKPTLEIKKKVSQIINKLPHEGENFSLSYSFETFDFELEIDKDDPQKGLDELKEYLKTEGIENYKDLKNIKIKYR